MAFTGYTIHEGLEPGQNGRFTQHGYIAFSGTDTTVSLPCRLSKITGFSLVPVGTPGADEVLSINATISDGGEIAPTSGALTVTRAAGTTSALKVAYRLIGY
jgi:hypothetical protein